MREPENPEALFQKTSRTSEEENGSILKGIKEDPQLLSKRIDLINQLGVIGERGIIAIVSSTIDSRLIEPDASGQQGLGLKVSGTQGTGKSHILESCLKLQDYSLYHYISMGSDKSLFHQSGSMKSKAVIFAEGFQLEKKADSGFAYGIRSLLSEGKVTHQVTEKNAKGKFQTVLKTVEGPISLLVSTISPQLEKQVESRMISVSPDESSKQTKAIIMKTASIAANGTPGVDASLIRAWQEFHKELMPAQVVIPFAEEIARAVIKGELLHTDARRSFKRFLSLIKAITIVYQWQREKNQQKQILADIADYFMASQILSEVFEEGIANHSDTDKERLGFIQASKKPLQMKELMAHWRVSKNAVSKWLKHTITDGFLAWCDDKGKPFSTEKELRTAKYAGDAYIKFLQPKKKHKSCVLLPSAFKLTKDPRWKEGGELWTLYNLRL